jgi:predicted nuclease of predicted toxin-antitoxin system
VKLLLDENISDRIVQQVADLFPGSTHIKSANLREADDAVIWEWAKQRGYTIVSKDTDFYQRAIVYGHPPKFIWLRVGNCPTGLITTLLRSRCDTIRQFIESETESLLVLER